MVLGGGGNNSGCRAVRFDSGDPTISNRTEPLIGLTVTHAPSRFVKFGIVEEARKYFRARHDVIDVDGVRVLFGDGWGLIRASNTQPVLVMRFEARTQEDLDRIRSIMEGWLREQGVAV